MVLMSADLRGARLRIRRTTRTASFPLRSRTGASSRTEVRAPSRCRTSTAKPRSRHERPLDDAVRRAAQAPTRIQGGRKLIVDSFEEEFPTGSIVSNVQVGRPRSLGVGAGSFDLLITVRVLGLRTDLHISIFQVERVLGGVVTVGARADESLSVMKRLAKVMAARMSGQLAPRSTAPPTVTGTAAVGQTLTATTGTWAGAPPTSRPSGSDATPRGRPASIPGATNPTYVVTGADVGSALRVSVTAQNAAGAGLRRRRRRP